jgi:small GTP-binding protein
MNKHHHILFLGNTGSGKSTTINALFNQKISKVGDGVDAETTLTKAYQKTGSPFVLWDSPGLGESIYADNEHSAKIKTLLNNRKMNIIVLVIEATKKDLGTTYKIIEEFIIKTHYQGKVILAINQIDLVKNGRYWDDENNLPSNYLLDFLNEQKSSIRRRIINDFKNITISMTICYSAQKKYNIDNLWKNIEKLSLAN